MQEEEVIRRVAIIGGAAFFVASFALHSLSSWLALRTIRQESQALNEAIRQRGKDIKDGLIEAAHIIARS